MSTLDPIYEKNLVKSSHQKSWYVYTDAGYSGPHLELEIVHLINSGKINDTCKIWTAEVGTWQDVSVVPSFEKALKAVEESRVASNDSSKDSDTESTLTWHQSDEFWAQVRQHAHSKLEIFPRLTEPAEINEKKSLRVQPLLSIAHRNKKVSLSFVAGAIVSLAFAFIFNNNHFSGSSYSYIPELTADENRQIKSAIDESPDIAGSVAAMGVLNINPQSPAFVIGTNLPEGSRVGLSISGLPETLLGTFQFSTQADLMVKNRLVRTQNLVRDNGKPIPIGEYKVSVICESCADNKVLLEKNIFLGGVKNNQYDLALRKYHEQLRQQARTELTEAKQIIDTIEHQYNDGNKKFAEVLQQGKVKEWSTAYTSWLGLNSQVGELVAKWNVQNDLGLVFYSQLFSQLQQTSVLVEKLHELQNKYVLTLLSRARGLSEIESQVASETAVTQTSLNTLRSQLGLLEQLPLYANGMPRNQSAR